MSDQKLKILVVDDSIENRGLIQLYMKRMGHETICANDGQAGVEAYVREKPDIILMDVMMPILDGYEATRMIRELCGSNWVPIIFLSANVEVEDQIEGIEAGGDDYLPKPINLELLKEMEEHMKLQTNCH